MSSNPKRLQYLFQRHLQDTATPEELTEFWKLFSGLDEDDPVKADIWRLWDDLDAEKRLKKKDWNDIGQRLHQQMTEWDKKQSISVIRRLTWPAAAIGILLIGVGVYFMTFNRSPEETTQTLTQAPPMENDLSPGGNRAVLILANGKKIILDSAQNGTLIRQGNTSIVKQTNGQLTYQAGLSNSDSKAVFNTLATPRGGQYKLTLPDGSKVWLNSASSIHFPAAFGRSAREVEITGEAYFEVTHLPAASDGGEEKYIPFIVHANGMAIEVLGTHFNINAYQDESVIKTTLLQGSVNVIKGNQRQLLTPGQQACVSGNEPIKIVKHPDLEAVMAWKNGYFEFQDDSISTIMRQVARWYDVNIKYEGDISQLFIGKVPRDVNVSTLFAILESTGWVHFSINGREIVVKP